jgi:protein gp37
MGTETAISWCDHTFNPWWGCTNVSPGCDHCYAETLAHRWKRVEWGSGVPRLRTSAENWRKPLMWDKQAKWKGVRKRVFSLSMGDWADVEVPEGWRADLFALISMTPHLDWLLLSKRHALVRKYLRQHTTGTEQNIRIGFTIENQDMADIRMPKLRQIKEMGFPTFVSYEPALSAVFWDDWMDPERARCIDWLIAGGESGPGYREPDPAWFEYARDACVGYNVPFHFKQWGGYRPGRTLGTREWLEFP